MYELTSGSCKIQHLPTSGCVCYNICLCVCDIDIDIAKFTFKRYPEGLFLPVE